MWFTVIRMVCLLGVLLLGAACQGSSTATPTAAATAPAPPTVPPTPTAEPSLTLAPTDLPPSVLPPILTPRPPTPTPPPPILTTRIIVNVRAGPGAGYALLGKLPRGVQKPILGKSQDSKWWQID